MANPATRDELKEWCLRSLGKPVVDINVDELLDVSKQVSWKGNLKKVTLKVSKQGNLERSLFKGNFKR